LSNDRKCKLFGLAMSVDAVLSTCDMDDWAECDGPPALGSSLMQPFP
jgi:hypothetical protein